MVVYDFNAPDADAVLRSSDEKEFHVHRLILTLASPVFEGMFSLPQPPSKTLTVDFPDPADILKPFIQYIYPRSPPKVTDISMWAALYTIADKYLVDAVMESLREILIPRFLETYPLRVYALASRWGFEEEAKIASRGTLTLDIFSDFPREDAELMGGGACQRLYALHFTRREAARKLVEKHYLPVTSLPQCYCESRKCKRLISVLSRCVDTRTWSTAEALWKELDEGDHPMRQCQRSTECRNGVKNMLKYFTSLLEGVSLSDFPETI